MNTAIDTKRDVKVEKFHRALRRSLSSDEIVDIAQRSARLASEIEQQEEELKTSTKHAKARIDELAAEKRRLELEIVDGGRLEEAQCERRTIYRLGVVQEVRCDTGQILNERPLSDRERNLELPLQQPVADEAENDDTDTDDSDDEAPEEDEDDADSDEDPSVAIRANETPEDAAKFDGVYDIDEDPPTHVPSGHEEGPLPTQKKTKAKKASTAKSRGK